MKARRAKSALSKDNAREKDAKRGAGRKHGAMAPSLVAMVLAAGSSRRMGEANKLLLPWGGATILRRAVERILEADLRALVVTGFDREAVTDALDGLPVSFVHNPSHGEGMGASLRTGAAALKPDVSGTLVFPGDMPEIRSETIRFLCDSFSPDAIVRPVFEGGPGHPVLFARRYFSELKALAGDSGARSVLHRHFEQVRALPVDDPGVLKDVDSPEDLKTS